MGKLTELRNAVNNILFDQTDRELQAEGWVHLYNVSQTAALLASSRGLDAGTCAAAGLLHDIYTFRTGQEEDHALHGSDEAARILAGIPGYEDAERDDIARMILRHSDKETDDGPLEECLKDADVLAHWLYERDKAFDKAKAVRIRRAMEELGLEGRVREDG